MNKKKIACELVKLCEVLLADSNRFQKAVNSAAYTMQNEVCANLQRVHAQLCALCEDGSFMDLSEEQQKKIQCWTGCIDKACKILTDLHCEMEKAELGK